MNDKKLSMSFDPHTIEHLGIKMYSRLPNAIAELIANSYDADAQNVFININNDIENRSITVIDDGVGMTFDEINEKFLRIGRKRRINDNGLSPSGKRKVTGRKGLGKLAFFGIGNIIEIETKKEGKSTSFAMKWDDIISSDGKNYEPKFSIKSCPSESGTIITLKDLKRQTTIDKNSLAISLSKLFNFFDNTFNVFVTINGNDPIRIDDKLKYENLTTQIEWKIPENKIISNKYFTNNKIEGKILATEKPLKPELRGITLFAHGRLVNTPEFFGVGESSHGYSYFTGWLNIDFVDEWEEDVISTDRQSLNWDLPLTEGLRQELQNLMHNIERDWREKRKQERRNQISTQTGINVKQWYKKLPNSIQLGVENIVNTVINDSELETESQNSVVNDLHKLIPEYPDYHWRHLHDEIKSAAKDNYEKKDYYHAIDEALKRYETGVIERTELQKTGQSLMFAAFGKNGILSVISKYKKTDGKDFKTNTKSDMEDAQQELSAGIFAGFRNPISHEEIKQLHDSGLLTEIDCLDSLSLLSHLFRRLDGSIKK